MAAPRASSTAATARREGARAPSVMTKAGAKPAAKTPSRPQPQRLSSVAAAVRLLKCFTDSEAELGVTTLARRLDLAKSTVWRLAATLVAEGMLEQNHENEKYRLGPALFGLGALVRQRMSVSVEARPHIFALRDATNETVHLAIMDGADIMYVYDLESTQAIRMRANLGERKPAFCSAEGRAMLAFLDDGAVEAAFARGLAPRTPRTQTDPAALRRALAKTRRQGYAFEDEECDFGMRSLAAPIRDVDGRVVAAVGLAGPMQRLGDAAIARLAPRVVETAAVISARLGYKQSVPS